MLENDLHSGREKVALKKSQKFFGVLAAACECAHQMLAPALQSEEDSGTVENRSLVSNMLSQPYNMNVNVKCLLFTDGVPFT